MKRPIVSFAVAVSIAAFGWVALSTLRKFDPALLFANPLYLGLALLFQIVNVFSQFWIWKLLLRGQGVSVPGVDIYRVYVFGSLGRYLPIGKLTQLGAIVLSSEEENRMNSVIAFVEWTAAGLLGGSLLMTLTCFAVEPRLAWVLSGIWILGAVALFAPNWKARGLPDGFLRLLNRLGKGGVDYGGFALSRRRIAAAAFALFFLSWITESLVLLSLFAVSHGRPGGVEAATILFSNTVAYFGGLLFFVVPGGLGVRESLFYWISNGKLGGFSAGFVPIAARASLIVAEILFFLPLVFLKRTRTIPIAADSENVERLFRSWQKSDGYPVFSEAEYSEILGHVPLLAVRGRRVLDVGCGVGVVGAYLKRMGHSVDGVDLVQESLDEAVRANRIDRGFAVEANRTGLPDASYDVIVCSGVLLYIFDLPDFFREARRLLRPGGELLIFDHHSANPYVKLHFGRPDWVDRLLEGRSNVRRRALDENLVVRSAGEGWVWERTSYLSMYTRHPNALIDLVHRFARVFFGAIRRLTRAKWTGNALIMHGRKGDI